MTLIVLPLFAFLNEGLRSGTDAFSATIAHPVTLGISLGLLGGNPIGVFVGTFIAVRTGMRELPEGMSFGHVVGAGSLAGIGFTMSVFISGLSFPEGSSDMAAAMGCNVASSVVAATAGAVRLR